MSEKSGSGERLSPGAAAQKLARLRLQGAYSRGELIDFAADVASQVGRPARREGTFTPGSIVGVDYEAINARYEAPLAATPGWDDATEPEIPGNRVTSES